MSDFLYVLASIGFLVWVIRSGSFWIHLLQENNYSLRQVKYRVRTIGKKRFFSPLSLGKWLLLFGYPYIIFNEAAEFPYHLAITIVYSLEGFMTLLSFSRQSLLRIKRLSVLFVILFLLFNSVIILLYLLAPIDRYLWLIVLDKLTLPLLVLLVLFVTLPEEFYWDYQSLRLTEKLKAAKDFHVTLLLGGERAVIPYQLLRYGIHDEAVIFIPQTDRRGLLSSLKKLDLSSLNGAIIHLSDANVQRIIEIIALLDPHLVMIIDRSAGCMITHAGKTYEDDITKIYETLSPQTKLIVNGDDEMLRSVMKTKKKKTILVSQKTLLRSHKQKKESTTMTVCAQTRTYHAEIPFVTETALQSALPAFMAFSYLHIVSIDLGKQRVWPDDGVHLYRPVRTHDVTTLVLTQEISPESFFDASSYIELYKQQKILIVDTESFTIDLPPKMLTVLGDRLARDYDYVFLLQSRTAKMLRVRIDASRHQSLVTVASKKEISHDLKKLIKKGDILVFAGSMARQLNQEFSL